MKRIITLFFISALLLAGLTVSAQQSEDVLLYKISPDEARSLYKGEKPGDHHFHTLVKAYKRTETVALPAGHYLQLEAWGEDLLVQLKSINSFQTSLIVNEVDFVLQISDSTGQWISDATVKLENKSIPYDPVINAYYKKKSYKDGLVEVEYNGEIVFLEIKDKKHQSLIGQRYYKVKNTTIGRILFLPVHFGKKAVRRVKYGRDGRRGRRASRSIKVGYVALNKPIYRPGDTLMMKAYIVNERQKPWKNDLQFSLMRGSQKVIVDTVLAPEKPGSFDFELVLGDSLDIDMIYYILMRQPGKENSAVAHRFYIKDYELNHFTFNAKAARTEFIGTDSVHLLVSALGGNGLPESGGTLEVVLKTEGISAIRDQEVFVADTLWRYSMILPAQEEVTISIPPGVLPKADLHLSANIHYKAPDGHLYQKESRFVVRKKNEQLSLSFEDGYLNGAYFYSGKSLERKAELQMQTAKGVVTESLELPFHRKPDPFAIQYTLICDSLIIDLNTSKDQPKDLLLVSGSNQLDTIQFEIKNSYGLPFTYFLYQEKKLYDKGQSNREHLIWQRKDKAGKNYKLIVEYIWSGKNVQKEVLLPFYKNKLQIKVEQPQRAIPNQEAPMKIEVKRNNGRSASGVNLSTGAYRSQFNNHAAIESPNIKYKPAKERLIYNRYRLLPVDHKRYHLPLTREWFEKLKLEGQAFYQLRLPEEGIFIQYDTITQNGTFYEQIAQFAPYVIENGKEQDIWMAYLDDQLIYYGGIYKYHPYSFVGEPGRHELTLRTEDKEYTITNVVLKKGQKLELSFDAERYQLFKSDIQISERTMPDYLLHHELRLLRKTMMEVKKLPKGNNCFLWADTTNIFFIEKMYTHWQQPIIVGPVKQKASLHFVQTDGFETEVPFDPGFVHEIQERRDRLYGSKTFYSGSKEKKRVSIPVPYHLPGELVWNPAIVKRKSESTPKFQLESFLSKKDPLLPVGHYWFEYKNRIHQLAAVVLQDATGKGQFYKYYTRYIGELPVGKYDLFLFRENGQYARKSILIRQDTLLCQQLDGLTYSNDSIDYYFQHFFLEDSLSKKDSLTPYFELLKGKELTTVQRPYMLSGQVKDIRGEPVIFGSIAIYQNGTLVAGTETDFDGFYQVAVPAGLLAVEASYIGYQKERVLIVVNENQHLDITMNSEGVLLEEVAVVAYGLSTGVIMPTENSMIRLQADYSPSSDDDLILQDKYSGLRTDFRDYAYFAPTLITDQDGYAYYTPTLPGNLSNWVGYTMGMDKKGRAGITFSRFQTYKPLTAQLYLPRFLLQGDQSYVKGQLSNYQGDSVEVNTLFQIEGRSVSTNKLAFTDGAQELLPIIANEKDSLHLQYQLEQAGYLDGEKKEIPILPVGTKEVDGYYSLLQADTSLEWQFDPEKGTIFFRAEGNVLDVIKREIQYLKSYPYDCNEQTASRLMAYLIERKWQLEQGISPIATDTILTLLGQLQRSQLSDGSWGWWPGGTTNNWMTVYVLQALRVAKSAGFEVPAMERGLRFIVNELPVLNTRDQLLAMELLVEMEYNIAYRDFLAGKDTLRLSVADRMRTEYIRQKAELPWSRDTVEKYKRINLLGGIYWGNPAGESIEASLIAYKILQDGGEKAGIKQYLLSNRRAGGHGWRNTYETAQILQTVFSSYETINSQHRLRLNGVSYDSFPVEVQIDPGRTIELSLEGEGGVLATAYQEYFNADPIRKSEIFDINTRIYQSGKTVEELKTATKAVVETKIKISKAADYVMIEIPIPAGCSYADTPKRRNEGEVHRQYFRHKVAIFCEHLEAGTYNFEVALEPRFSGSYTMNPVRAELMYLPSFYGQNGAKKIEISKP